MSGGMAQQMDQRLNFSRNFPLDRMSNLLHCTWQPRPGGLLIHYFLGQIFSDSFPVECSLLEENATSRNCLI